MNFREAADGELTDHTQYEVIPAKFRTLTTAEYVLVHFKFKNIYLILMAFFYFCFIGRN